MHVKKHSNLSRQGNWKMADPIFLRQELLARIRESGELILRTHAIESHFPNGDVGVQVRNFSFDNNLIFLEIDSGIQFKDH